MRESEREIVKKAAGDEGEPTTTTMMMLFAGVFAM